MHVPVMQNKNKKYTDACVYFQLVTYVSIHWVNKIFMIYQRYKC